MIIEAPADLDGLHPKHIGRFKGSEAVADTFALIVHFLDAYVSKHSGKNYILRDCKVEAWHIDCLNTILQNFRIKKLIVTPHILSEFINKIRRDAKSDYKDIMNEFLDELIDMDEISIRKTNFLKHQGFPDYGNDVSICLASDGYLNANKYLTIISSDGRFIRSFFGKQKNILAFNIDTLGFYFAR